MIIKPSELPTAEEATISPALRRVSGWRLDNHEAGPTLEKAVEFGRSHRASFFQSVRAALSRIDDRLHNKPAT